MYEILDETLLQKTTCNSWYNDGVDYTQGMLNEFDNTDWIELNNLLNYRDDEWKIKLAYIINDDYGINGLNILLKLLETENHELIVTCLDSFREFEIHKFKQVDMIKEILLTKLELVSNTSSMPVKMVLNDLVNKLNLNKDEIKDYVPHNPKFPKLEKLDEFGEIISK